jgi:lipopolysaccharide export system permease protein
MSPETPVMKLLDRYIAAAMAKGTGIALLVIMGLNVFFSIIEEIDELGEGSYGISKMLEYVALTLPRGIYELFPTAALIGGLSGMGALAVNGELVAMRASGLSVWRIVRSVMQAGLVLLVVVVALGEGLAPVAEQYAQRLRAGALDKHVSYMGREGVWVRDQSRYIYVNKIFNNDTLADVSVFEFDQSRQLISSMHADTAAYRGGKWVLHNMRQTLLAGESVKTRVEETSTVPALLAPELINVVVLQPENMSVQDIRQFLGYLQTNGLETQQYRYALYSRFVTPASVLLMLFISVPFVFGSLRSTGTGQRFLVGIMAGFGFYLTNQLAAQAGQVYGWSPLLVSIVPGLAVMLAGIYALRRV